MKQDYKNYLLILLIITCAILIYDISNRKEILRNKENEIKELNNSITAYKENELQLKEDKLFYKDLYIELAEDYNNRLHKLGIKEYILTDTSR